MFSWLRHKENPNSAEFQRKFSTMYWAIMAKEEIKRGPWNMDEPHVEEKRDELVSLKQVATDLYDSYVREEISAKEGLVALKNQEMGYLDQILRMKEGRY